MGADLDGIGSLQSALDDLKEDWGGGGGGSVTYVVGTSVDYGLYIEFGTAPHTITPDDAETLKFSVGGTTVFTDRVEHPGTDPSPFMRPALDRVATQLGAIAKTATGIEDFVRKVALAVEAEAKKILTENGNVDTGRLRSSIQARRVD